MGKENGTGEKNAPGRWWPNAPLTKMAPLCNQSQGQSTLLLYFCLDFLESRKLRHIRTESREKERGMF